MHACCPICGASASRACERVCRTCERWTKSVVPADHYCGWHRHVTNPEDYCSRWVRRDEHKGC